MNARMLPETEEASTAMEQQPQSRQYPFVPPARESVMKDSRIESEDTIDKRNKREKRKNKNNNSISEQVRRARNAAVADHFMARRSKGFFQKTIDLTAIERIYELPLRLSS